MTLLITYHREDRRVLPRGSPNDMTIQFHFKGGECMKCLLLYDQCN